MPAELSDFTADITSFIKGCTIAGKLITRMAKAFFAEFLKFSKNLIRNHTKNIHTATVIAMYVATI